MKNLCIILIFFGISFISANPKVEKERDTVTVLMKSNNDEAVKKAYLELKVHIDSIHHANAMERLRLHEVSVSLIKQLVANDSLRMENERLERQKYVSMKTMEYLYYFLLMIAGSLVAKGVFEGFRNRKHDE